MARIEALGYSPILNKSVARGMVSGIEVFAWAEAFAKYHCPCPGGESCSGKQHARLIACSQASEPTISISGSVLAH